MNIEFLKSAIKQFKYYKFLGDETILQLDENDFFWQYNAESNSIAIIIKHLHGNMKSRWTDFLESDGEKEWRNRDEEFELNTNKKSDIISMWEQGWACLFDTLESLKEEDFSKKITIRNEEHSISEAINRQLAHYPYHVGQIVLIGKMLKNESWKSLSIPKGKSSEYNEKMVFTFSNKNL